MIIPNSRYPLTRILSGVIFLLVAVVGLVVMSNGISDASQPRNELGYKPNGWPYIILGLLMTVGALVLGCLVNVIVDIADAVADLRTNANMRSESERVPRRGWIESAEPAEPAEQPAPAPLLIRPDRDVLRELERIAALPADQRQPAKRALAAAIRREGAKLPPDVADLIIALAIERRLVTDQEGDSLRRLLKEMPGNNPS